MNLKKLQHYISEYRKFLRRNRDFEGLFIWESQKNWQKEFDIDALHFADTYDASLQNSYSKRLWKGDNYLPKEMLLKFIKMQPEFVRFMFKDLLDESKDITGRVGRFVFHCDELLTEYKDNNRNSIENNHFHDDDFHIISIYLSFQYPNQYALYNFRDFRQMLVLLGSTDVPEINDFGRYVKVVKTLYKLLSKDEELMDFHKKRLDKNSSYLGDSLLLVTDFIAVCVNDRRIRAFG